MQTAQSRNKLSICRRSLWTSAAFSLALVRILVLVFVLILVVVLILILVVILILILVVIAVVHSSFLRFFIALERRHSMRRFFLFILLPENQSRDPE